MPDYDLSTIGQRPADAAVFGAAGVTSGLARGSLKIVAMGDSQTALANQSAGTTTTWGPNSYLTHLRQKLGRRFDMRLSDVYATAGARSDQVIATHLDNVIAAKPDVVLFQCGRNDISQGVAATTLIANWDAAITRMTNAGIIVVMMTMLPYTSAYITTNYSEAGAAPVLLQRRVANRWLTDQALARRNFYVVDPAPAVTDWSTGYMAASMAATDDLHPSWRGADVISDVFLPTVTRLFPTPAQLPLVDVQDIYSASSPQGFLTTNPLLTGTGGTASNGATGTIATGWTIGQSASSTVSVAGQQVAATDFVGRTRQVITLGGTGQSSTTAGLGRVTQGIPSTNFAVGDRVIIEAEVEWTNVVGLTSLHAFVQTNGATPNSAAADGAVTGTTLGQISPSGRRLFRSDPITINPGFTSITAALRWQSVDGAAMAGAITIGSINVHKIAA